MSRPPTRHITIPADLDVFPDRLRYWREFRELSGIELADRIGCTRVHVHSMEAGVGRPSLPMLRKLCLVLDCTPNDLLWA